MDSITAKRFRVMDRPLNKEQIKYFLDQFGMRDVAKPESTVVNWVYRDKKNGTLTYETGISDLGYVNGKVPMLNEKDFIADSLIRSRTDALLKKLLAEKAEGYVFANHEITLVQKKEGEGKGKVSPPVPAFYTGRYLRKLEDRIILGDAFQIRLGYGEGGAVQFFSFRDPVVAEGGTTRVPAKQFILDSLARWQKSRTRPRSIIYPYHPDKLRVRSLKPIKAFDSYVLTQEKFRDAHQQDGTYLMPTLTVLAEAVLVPPTSKLSHPVAAEPVLLHFNFPCRPESGLCWPDGKQEMQSAPAPIVKGAPPARGPASPTQGSTKPEIPSPAPAKTTAPAGETKPAPKAN
jgi:hypothetical protein